jgi:hypothetical protein
MRKRETIDRTSRQISAAHARLSMRETLAALRFQRVASVRVGSSFNHAPLLRSLIPCTRQSASPTAAAAKPWRALGSGRVPVNESYDSSLLKVMRREENK